MDSHGIHKGSTSKKKEVLDQGRKASSRAMLQPMWTALGAAATLKTDCSNAAEKVKNFELQIKKG